MEKVFRKRAIRDLKENKFRYLALAFLIILSMYLVISMIGAADTIIDGTAKVSEECKIEDGQFQVFVPLTSKQKKDLEADKITIEEAFYLNFEQKDGSTLRVFKNRKKIDKIHLDEGKLPKNDREVVLEKRYATVHHLKTGSKITIDQKTYKVVGIGSVPDYEACYEKLSDSTVDSKQFGLAFVTDRAYQKLKNGKHSIQSEEYIYAYRLNGAMSDKQLKNKLKKITFNPDQINDPYFKDYWEEVAGKKDDIKQGITKLTNASNQMADGLGKLSKNNATIQKGANQIFESMLKTAQSQLSAFGVTSLTEDNYASVIKGLMQKTNDGLTRLSLESAKEQLDALKAYRDGIKAYTNGVKKASDGSNKLKEGTDQLEDATEELMKAFDLETSNLTQFLKAKDNPRIGAAGDDQLINKVAGYACGVIIMILFTYVISVFVIHGIEKESSMIGTLYALGVSKKQLLKYYLMLPVFVTFVAGLVGTIIGYTPLGIPSQMQDCYDYYSLPKLNPELLPYMLVYGIIMPPVIAIIVNYIVIRKKLSRPALSMIRNEQKKNHISKVKLTNMSFLAKFRIRQTLRELRSQIAVIFGMFIALLIMMIGLDCYELCEHISTENKADTKFEYMYTYKYPDKKVPKGGDACFVKSLKKEVWGYDLEISLIGMENDNPYFSQDKDLPKAKNKIVISSAMAQKYQLKKGDSIILSDEEEGMDYAFHIADITQYSSGLYAFMDIDSMRDLMNVSDDYYNMVVSKKKLPIESGKLYAITSKKAIEQSSDVFINMTLPMMGLVIGISVIIFAIVMYLMMKVMIDRSAQNIALMKVFGYRKKEIKKLYLDGNFYTIAIGALICVPLSKVCIDAMYPAMVSNIACGMNLTFSWQLYVIVYVGIILTYLVINQLLVRKIYKVELSDALKNRE